MLGWGLGRGRSYGMAPAKTPYTSPPMQKTLLPAVLVSALVGAGAALLVAPLVWGPPEASPRDPVLAALAAGPEAAPTEAPRPEAALLPAGWLDRLDALEARLGELEARPSAVAPTRTPLAALDAGRPESVVEADAIEALVQEAITADYERREQDREQRREEEQREWIDLRADRLAEELGLGSADRNRLAEVLNGEADRRRELMDEMRETGPTGDVRDRFREIRTWKEEELTAQLGADIATQVLERDRGGRGPGGGREGGRGGGFGGGPGGSGGSGRQ